MLRFAHPILEKFSRQCLAASGAAPEQSSIVARVLTWCDLEGRVSQGNWRLPILCKRFQSGALNGQARPTVESRGATLARVDADGASGHYAGVFAMEHAIALAKNHGTAAVTVYNSNYFGAGAYYVRQAAQDGCLAFASSNSFPKVLAHGGRLPVLGTNPMAFGAPRGEGPPLLVDLATSASAGSAVRKKIEAGESLDAGVAVDASGAAISDPQAVAQGALLPMAGAKGFALALMVETLSGVLAGAGIGSGVGSMYGDLERSANNGHFFWVLDVSAMIGRTRFDAGMEQLANAVLASGDDVHLPGAGRAELATRQSGDGIKLDPATVDSLAELAQSLKVDFPEAQS